MGSNHCFVCGPDNPFGLHIHFVKTDKGVKADFLCEARHCGWPGLQHGGITASILDEACAYVPYFEKIVTVTGELKLHYGEAIREGEMLHISAWPVKITKRLLEVKAQIVGPDNKLKAKAHAKMMVLNQRQMEQAGFKEPVL